MLELNLLPKNMRGLKKRKLQFAQRMKLVKLSSVFVLIAFGVIFFILMIFVQTSRSKVANLESEHTKLEPKISELESIEEEIDEVKEKLNVLGSIVQQDVKWSEIMEGLSKSILENVWLTSFEARRSRSSGSHKQRGRTTGTGALTLRGFVLGESEYATTQVAQMVTSLKNELQFSRYFENIELENMQSTEIEGEQTMNFVIKCDFKGEEDVNGE